MIKLAARGLLRLARAGAKCLPRRALGRWIVWGWTHMPFLIPSKPVFENEWVAAFYHPQPVYAVHLLIVPKRAISGLEAVSEADAPWLAAVFTAARAVVEQLHLEERGYRLVANGGLNQDVPQLHFHLIAD